MSSFPAPEPGADALVDIEQFRRPTLFKSLDEFCREYQPLSYAIEPIIHSGSLYTLTAKTGHGKTGVLVTAGFAIASGKKEVLKKEVERGRVAYLALENPDDIRMRMMVTADRLGITIDDVKDWIAILDARRKPEEVLIELQRLGGAHRWGLITGDTLPAFFDGKDLMNPVEAGEFIRRLRPLTQLQGKPAVVMAAHPVKNASQDQLIPYGSGAILNEVDGNLTLWRENGIASLHWQGKLRGLEFEPLLFKSELCGCDDVLDNKGRQVMLPVFLPTTTEVADARESSAGTRNLTILRALLANPRATQRELAVATGISKGSVSRALGALLRGRFIEKGADEKYRLTIKGEKELEELA